MSNVSMTIWGRMLNLSVAFDCYENEEVLPEQTEALDRLIGSGAIEDSRTAVENYCLKKNQQEIGESSITNIFKYVMPYSLYVRRSVSSDRYVGLVCRYRFNPEDGLVVLFKNEKICDIGTTDIL